MCFEINYTIDVNECFIDNGNCGHTCINTPGSHHCNCDNGYKLIADGHNCSGM